MTQEPDEATGGIVKCRKNERNPNQSIWTDFWNVYIHWHFSFKLREEVDATLFKRS